MTPPPDDLEALLRLRCVPGLGTARLRTLLAEHGSADAVLALGAEVLGAGYAESRGNRISGRIGRVLRQIDELRVRVLVHGRAGFPRALEELHQPPPLLFVRGNSTLLESGGVAIVGTRRPAEYGTGAAAELAAGVARAGLTVWSGMARGIDAIAHRAALDAGGTSAAVLGCGIDVVYPPEHAALAERLATDGALLSEYLPGEPPLPHHFPERNRIIAALATGVVVVEAREDGGALITAEQALELGRAVMAVPGPVGRVTSYGPNRLIQDGAKLVMEVADILEELGYGLNAPAARARPSARRRWTRRPPDGRGEGQGKSEPRGPSSRPGESGPRTHARAGGAGAGEAPPPRKPVPVAPRYQAVWEALGTEPRHVDEIAAACGRGIDGLLPLLLELEVDGRVRHAGGNRYGRVA